MVPLSGPNEIGTHPVPMGAPPTSPDGGGVPMWGLDGGTPHPEMGWGYPSCPEMGVHPLCPEMGVHPLSNTGMDVACAQEDFLI